MENIFSVFKEKGVYFTFTEKNQIDNWLKELYFSKKIENYRTILKNKEIIKILNNKKFTEKERGEKIYNYIKGIRYPVLTQIEKRFKKISDKFFHITGIKAVPPPYFEGNNIIFKIKSINIDKSYLVKKYKNFISELEKTFIKNYYENNFQRKKK